MTAVTNLDIKTRKAKIQKEQAYIDFPITFPQPFGGLPEEIIDNIMVIGTVELVKSNVDALYAVNITDITEKGFIARIGKIFGTSENWNDLQLNYTAKRLTLYGGK